MQIWSNMINIYDAYNITNLKSLHNSRQAYQKTHENSFKSESMDMMCNCACIPIIDGLYEHVFRQPQACQRNLTDFRPFGIQELIAIMDATENAASLGDQSRFCRYAPRDEKGSKG